MAISDEELTRQLESVPLVEGPDLRDAVLAKLSVRAGFSRPPDRLKPVLTPVLTRRQVLVGLAWAAAAVIVIGVAVERVSLQRSHAAATIAPIEEWSVVSRSPELTIRRSGDRFALQPAVQGQIDWDHSKLVRTEVLANGGIVLQRRVGAAGPATIRLLVGGKEILKTSI